MSDKIVQLNEKIIKTEPKEWVRNNLERSLNDAVLAPHHLFCDHAGMFL